MNIRARARRESAIAAASAAPAKPPMASTVALDVGVQIEPRAVHPGVPREKLARRQPEMIVERVAGVGEQLVEHAAHREHRGAGVDGGVRRPSISRSLPPGGLRALEHHLTPAPLPDRARRPTRRFPRR